MNSKQDREKLQQDLAMIEVESELLDGSKSSNSILNSLYKEIVSMNLGDFSSSTEREKVILQILKTTAEAISKTNSNIQHQSEKLVNMKADLKAYRLRVPPTQRNDSFLARLESQLEELGKI